MLWLRIHGAADNEGACQTRTGTLVFSSVFDCKMVFVGIKTDRNVEAVQKEQDRGNTAQTGKTRGKSGNIHPGAVCLTAVMAALIFCLFSHIIANLSSLKQRKEAV